MSAPGRGLPPLPGFSAALYSSEPSSSAPLPSGLPPLQSGQSAVPAEHARWWLQAKAEEEKRRQEEEKTKQEGIKLEQRRIEQSMLRDSIRVGVPPALLPMIFAGISGVSTGAGSDLFQHPVAQRSFTEARSAPHREGMGDTSQQLSSAVASSSTHQIDAWPTRQQQFSTTTPAQGGHFIPYCPPNTELPAGVLTAPTSAPRSSQNTLPRLSTAGSQVPHILNPSGPPYGNPESVLPVSYTTTTPASAIQFVPYVYPSSQTTSHTQPPTPEYSSSPRKRKATGSHPSAPMPTLSPSPMIGPVGRTHSSASSYVVRSDNTSEQRSTASPRVAQLLHNRDEVVDGRRSSNPPQQRPRRQSLLQSPEDKEVFEDLSENHPEEPHQGYRSRTDFKSERRTPAAVGLNCPGVDPGPSRIGELGPFLRTFDSRPP